MGTVPSANNQDPSLYCAYIGGPLDGQKTGDLPAVLSGKKLTGMVSKSPLAQPAHGSIFAVYECTSETQVNGFWIFEYRGLEGPNGETLVAKTSTQKQPAKPRAKTHVASADLARFCAEGTSADEKDRIVRRLHEQLIAALTEQKPEAKAE